MSDIEKQVHGAGSLFAGKFGVNTPGKFEFFDLQVGLCRVEPLRPVDRLFDQAGFFLSALGL
ncbi:MAG: hypothetical protein WBQ86_06195 [Candidatus Binatus sp.]